MLGIPIELEIDGGKQVCLIQAERTSRALLETFPNCKQVALTFRFDNPAGGTRYYATLFDGNELHYSYEYQTEDVVDRVGSGDCFMAGLIHANLYKWRAEQVVEFAAAAAFDKLFQPGDTTWSSASAIKAMIRK